LFAIETPTDDRGAMRALALERGGTPDAYQRCGRHCQLIDGANWICSRWEQACSAAFHSVRNRHCGRRPQIGLMGAVGSIAARCPLANNLDTLGIAFAFSEKRAGLFPSVSVIGRFTSIGQGANIDEPAFISSGKRAPVSIGK
jgi:hypothetical protein